MCQPGKSRSPPDRQPYQRRSRASKKESFKLFIRGLATNFSLRCLMGEEALLFIPIVVESKFKSARMDWTRNSE